MKYLLGILAIALIVVGIFIGFDMGDKSAEDSSTTSTSSSVTNAKILDLSNTGLTKVNASIYSKHNTTDLILSNNSIKTLPSEMGKMNNVIIFKIDHNLLDGSLIGEIRQMSGLKILDVSYNKMTGMPAEIGQLSNLQTLNYSYNNISGLPNELSKLKNNLKEFNLTGNPLSQDQINRLKTALPNTTIVF